MAHSDTIDVLNELLVLHYRSLPQYIRSVASPWTHHGDEQAIDVVRDISEDQQKYCIRLADIIQRRGGLLDQGEFPMDFAELHDLSLDFLVTRLISEQQMDIDAIEQCLPSLSGDVAALTLAEEALGAGKAHLQSLEELPVEVAVTIA